jgi:hypothetical protein
VSLPFFFLFPLPSFSCCRLFSLLWSSESRRFHSPPPMASHLRVPTAPFSHRHLPQRCLQPNLVRVSPVNRLAFYFPVLALFPVIFCFFFFFLFSLFFGFGFSLYCSFSTCFVCVLFLQFSRSPLRQVHRPPPTARLYFTPPPPPPATNFKRTC